MYTIPFLFRVCKFSVVLFSDHCDMCKKYFDKSKTEVYSVYYDDAPHSFCCKTCMNVYILANRKIVPCNWCKVRADVALCEQINTATLGILHSLNLFFPISARVFVSPAKTSRTATLSLLECLCLLSLFHNCIFRKQSINWHVGFLKDFWLDVRKNIDFLLRPSVSSECFF